MHRVPVVCLAEKMVLKVKIVSFSIVAYFDGRENSSAVGGTPVGVYFLLQNSNSVHHVRRLLVALNFIDESVDVVQEHN